LTELSYREVNDNILQALKPPRPGYYFLMAFLGAVITWAIFCWIYQVKKGLVVAGINIPVGWGVYIANFVFWVGIAHSGTLISAILHLVRSKWRTAVSRSSEAMTIFAIMTAGLFPLVHLGRVWVFYYIIPYPSQRRLWPNFISPLVWDVVAVGTYFTVSLIFFYVGLIPDLAAARDRVESELGANHPKTKFYRYLSIGWSGSGSQWLHHGRGYLYFAALATPLVVSVHSVVSWDFATSMETGWHTTLYAPYFVAGAIFSGLAMVLALTIPMRKVFHLERLLHIGQLEQVARTMIVTGVIIGYSYAVENFTAWYSGEIFERQFIQWRATASWITWIFWMLPVLNFLLPVTFIFPRLRRNFTYLFVASILVIVGMWLERVVIVTSSTAHDYLPHTWSTYAPTWVEISITAGSFAFFFFWFFLFAKLFPVIAISDVKEGMEQERATPRDLKQIVRQVINVRKSPEGVLAIFKETGALVEALKRAAKSSDQLEVYSPMRITETDKMLGRRRSPVRVWTFFGALCGLAGGFALAIGAASSFGLIVGAKHPVSLIPYCIVGFEGTVLLGSIANLMAVLFYAKLGPAKTPPWYDGRFSLDRYGLYVACARDKFEEVKEMLSEANPEEIRFVHEV
jgi:molybdopterin-containing oxidoreductase family membrane subunit